MHTNLIKVKHNWRLYNIYLEYILVG